MESSIRSRIFAPDGNCSPYLCHYYLTGIFTQLPVVSLTRIRYLLATAKINQEQQCAQLTPSPGIFLDQKYFLNHLVTPLQRGCGSVPPPSQHPKTFQCPNFLHWEPGGMRFPYRSSVPNSPLSHLRCQAHEFVVALPLRHNQKCCASHNGGLAMTLAALLQLLAPDDPCGHCVLQNRNPSFLGCFASVFARAGDSDTFIPDGSSQRRH